MIRFKNIVVQYTFLNNNPDDCFLSHESAKEPGTEGYEACGEKCQDAPDDAEFEVISSEVAEHADTLFRPFKGSAKGS